MRDRRVLAGAAFVLLLLTAGCVGFLTGEERLAFDASPVEVAADAHAEAGYEEVRVESTEANQSFTVGGQTRTVSVTNRVAGYRRAAELAPTGTESYAQFTVFATPQVEVGGQALNEVAHVSERELIDRLRTGYGSLTNVRSAGDRTVQILGQDRTVSRFTATSTDTEREVELTLQVSTFRHGEDVVVAVGVYPARLGGEEARITTLLRGVEHELEG